MRRILRKIYVITKSIATHLVMIGNRILLFAKDSVKYIDSKVGYSKLLLFIEKCSLGICAITVIVIVLSGLLLNYLGREKFPLFAFYQGVLLANLWLSFLSARKNMITNRKLDILMSSDLALALHRITYKTKRESNINYLVPITLASCIVLLIKNIIILKIDEVFQIYCYVALWTIVFVSTVGYTQYMRFIAFVARISKSKDLISNYNHTLPSETEWLMEISGIASTYSMLFFVVGGLFIYLFYNFTFSGSQTIELYHDAYFALFLTFWVALILGIAVAFPVFSILTSVLIRNIVKKLKKQRIDELTRLKDLSKSVADKNSYDSLIILINKTSSYPENFWFRYCISYVVGILNVGASAIATIQFINIL